MLDIARVIFVLGMTGGGGAENQCLYLLDELHRRGIGIELVYFRRGPQHARFEAIGAPLHEIQARLPVTVEWQRRAVVLRQLVGPHQPEILHTWLYEAHHVGLFAARTWPHTAVVLSHRTSGMYAGATKHALGVRLQRRRIDHLVANSSPGAESARRIFGLSGSQISVIGNAIPSGRVRIRTSRREIRHELGVSPAAPVVCSVGRVDHQRTKDYPTLFASMERVWADLPEAQLVVVGPQRDDLSADVGRPISDRAHTVGWQEHPVDWMNAADVVVVHSRLEGHSNVADEALMLGLPVASTDVGGHPALVAEAGGRVVPVGRGDLLAAAILDLLRAPPSRESVSGIAWERLAIDTAASAYERTYHEVLRRRATPPSR